MSNFEGKLKTFVEIDNELKRVANEVKELKQSKLDLENSLSEHMVHHEIEEHSCMDNTKVKVYTKKSSSNVFTKPIVYECALTLFGQDQADALVKLVEERKEVRESTGLKRMSSTRKRGSSEMNN